MKTFGLIYKTLLLLFVSTMSISVNAQDLSKVTARILNQKDTVVCDAIKTNIRIEIVADKDASFNFQIAYTVGTQTEYYPKKNEYQLFSELKSTTDNGRVLYLNLDKTLSKDKLIEHLEWKLKYIEVYTYDQKSIDDQIHKTTIVRTPDALIAIPDSITLKNNNSLCGYSVPLEAKNRVGENSTEYEFTYSWDVLTNEGILSDKVNAQTYLNVAIPEERSKRSDGIESSVKLVLTTKKGACRSETISNYTFLGRPKGTITGDDVYICSAIEEDNDFKFKGNVVLDGTFPIKYKLSTDAELIEKNTSNFDCDIFKNVGGPVLIESLVDKNGCISEASDHIGKINVIDRKPILVAPTEPIPVEGLTFDISLPFDSKLNSFKLEKAEEYESYDMSVIEIDDSSDDEVIAKIESNMAGLLGFNYIEINKPGSDDEECISSVPVFVDVTLPIRNPNGFSPNEDGINDYLVFEGLPDENTLIVFDSKGSIVYKTDNYRNNWNAEGLEDGYYMYVLEGKGIKTLKETFVIKRK